LGVVWIGLVVVLGLWRPFRSGVAQRRLLGPVLVSASLYLGLVAGDFLHSGGRGFLSNDSVELRLWTAEAVALCMLAAGASWERVRAWRTRSALAALVVELQRSPEPGGLQAALARRLGDPNLGLFHRLADGRLVDAAGRRHAARPDQELTPLVCGGRELAAIAHRPGLLADSGLGPEVATAVQLALDNERLQAELRAQLQDLRASRARIVEAGDQERRRLERDLHDGAQQRLITLSLAIGLARTQLEPGGEPQLMKSLQRAQEQLVELLATLRELAHGLYPVALAEEGFAAAVEALAEEPLARLRIERPLPQERLEPAVESAAYLVVREMVRGRRRGWTSIWATHEHNGLLVEVAAGGGPPADVLHLEDRVGAVGGRLQVERTAGEGTRVRAELPCA
jgi:signal transduction histidine kinase